MVLHLYIIETMNEPLRPHMEASAHMGTCSFCAVPSHDETPSHAEEPAHMEVSAHMGTCSFCNAQRRLASKGSAGDKLTRSANRRCSSHVTTKQTNGNVNGINSAAAIDLLMNVRRMLIDEFTKLPLPKSFAAPLSACFPIKAMRSSNHALHGRVDSRIEVHLTALIARRLRPTHESLGFLGVAQ